MNATSANRYNVGDRVRHAITNRVGSVRSVTSTDAGPRYTVLWDHLGTLPEMITYAYTPELRWEPKGLYLNRRNTLRVLDLLYAAHKSVLDGAVFSPAAQIKESIRVIEEALK